MTPPQKIAWGIVLTLLVVTSPIGLWLLLTGLWQLHVPKWRLRTYVRQAGLEPANAAALLAQAAAIDPSNPEVLAPLAELKLGQGDHVAALALYRQYCEKVPSDWLARGHLALAALKSNQVDEAIAELVAIRQGATATEDSMASVTAHLAYAYLCKEDPQQALVFVERDASHAMAGCPGAQQCLFYRGVCQYMLGRTGDAIRDLDRLYAINPSYDGVQAAKDAMVAGTYELLLPDGTALVPVTPGHITRSAVKVERTAPRSPHCLNCQAPLRLGALECAYCHAWVGSGSTPPYRPHS
jgi:tetratricopeptide (TPR) repeat protein